MSEGKGLYVQASSGGQLEPSVKRARGDLEIEVHAAS